MKRQDKILLSNVNSGLPPQGRSLFVFVLFVVFRSVTTTLTRKVVTWPLRIIIGCSFRRWRQNITWIIEMRVSYIKCTHHNRTLLILKESNGHYTLPPNHGVFGIYAWAWTQQPSWPVGSPWSLHSEGSSMPVTPPTRGLFSGEDM